MRPLIPIALRYGPFREMASVSALRKDSLLTEEWWGERSDARMQGWETGLGDKWSRL